MKNVKLFDLLKSISKKEFIDFKRFVVSPVFNNNNLIVKLYEYLLTNYEEVIKVKVTRYKIYEAAFGVEKFNETKYWKIISSFASLIDKYLMYNQYELDKYYQRNILLEAYRSRNLQKPFAALSKNIQKNFDTEFNKGLNFLVNQTHYYFQNVSYLGTGSPQDFDKDIEKLFENLRMFFVMTNIVSVSIISNLKEDFISNSMSKLWLFENVVDYLNENKAYVKKNYLTVYIFFLIILSKIHTDEERYYFEAKESIWENRLKFSSNLLRHILLNILDYSFNKLISGNEKFLSEFFEINKFMDENSLTLFGEYIHGEYFYSVIEHSTMLKEISWAEDFAGKYKQYLSGVYRESVINIGLSRIAFENKDYVASLQHLLTVENINPYFYLSQKILLIQNNYELKNFDAIPFIVETLSKYLKRRIDISDEQKDNYVKFLYYFRKLKAVSSTRKYLLLSYERQLLKEKFFLQKNWFNEKINELKLDNF